MPPLATLKVEFAPLRNNLVNLSQSLSSLLFSANIAAQHVIVELEPGAKPGEKFQPPKEPQQPLCLGWTGLYSAKEDTIELDPTVALTLGLVHGQQVKVSINPKAPRASRIYVEALTLEDFDVVHSDILFFERSMIYQLRAVIVGQLVTVFPSPSRQATLKITKLEPHCDGVAFVDPEGEVIVGVKAAESETDSELSSSVPNSAGSSTSSVSTAIVTRCSVYPYVEGCDTRELEIRGQLPFVPGTLVAVSLATPASLGANSNHAGEEQEVSRATTIYATYTRDDLLNSVSALSYGLSSALGLVKDNGIGVRVLVRSPKDPLQALPRLQLRPFVFTTHSKSMSSQPPRLTAEELTELGIKNGCKGLIIPPIDGWLPNGGILDCEGELTGWGLLKDVVKGAETPLPESKAMPKLTDTEDNKRPVVGQEKVHKQLLDVLRGGNGVLLHGSRGCGKSVVITEAVNELKRKHIKPIYFKCSLFTDKALPTVREALKRASYDASWSAPSVVVFDDIDKMIPAKQEHSGDTARQQQLAELFCNIWHPLIAQGKVSILATAQDQASIHNYLLTSHLLETVVKLKSPHKELREQILRAAIDASGLQPAANLDLLDVVAETEGYQPGDLWILVDRLSAGMAMSESMEATTSDIIDLTKDFTPASLRGVKLEKPSTKWDEVGGLVEAKRVVLETLEWPTKYAEIFANCPLRLRSGLLFYGYPGCGKTMLAGAIASQTGLNFISVKGPEILNKYIGASEQSVRDLFDRAQAAKPCVLFFDEFDSIAPKRGHDSTGVTDRVVNQLLTQMDGAEGLDGVYVLAATSRPDMIDSALLRPGRLDKSLLCDMPNTSDRYDIVVRAAKKLTLEESIDLQEVAEKTQGFTGADLQALVYNAYLSAVHKSLEASAAARNMNELQQQTDADDVAAFQIGDHGDIGSAVRYAQVSAGHLDAQTEGISSTSSATTSVIVTAEDLARALSESKPSISAKEVARFKAIYSEFYTDRNGEMPPGTSSTAVGARVTLQ